MKVDWEQAKSVWNGWDIGGKIMVVSACVGVLALFFPWVAVALGDASGVDASADNGWEQGAFLILSLWAYPLYMQLRNKNVDLMWSLSCPVLAVLVMVLYLAQNNWAVEGGGAAAAAVTGDAVYVFLLSAVGFLVGVFLYQKSGGHDRETASHGDDSPVCDGYATKWPFFFESRKGYWRIKPPYWTGLGLGLACYVLKLWLCTGITAFFVVAAIVSRNHWQKSTLKAVADTASTQ